MDPQQIKAPHVMEYQAVLEGLRLFRDKATHAFAQARDANDLAQGQSIVTELSDRLDTFKNLRTKLSHQELFIADFNVQVPEQGTVSLTIPRGISRIELVDRAIASRQTVNGPIVYPPVLRKWREEPQFKASLETEETIVIKGHVSGTQGKGTRHQEEIIVGKGYSMVNREDLAVAHLAYFVATGENFFGWYTPRESFCVRTYYSLLDFGAHGLSDIVLGGQNLIQSTVMAGRIASSLPRASAHKSQ